MPVSRRDSMGSNNDTHVRRVSLYATAAVTAGQVAMINTSDTTYGAGFSCKLSDASDSPLAFGVFTQTTTAAGFVEVQVGGYNSTPTDSGSGISAAANVGSAASGAVKSLGSPSATVWPFAVCVDAFTASTADGAIMINDKGWYKHG